MMIAEPVSFVALREGFRPAAAEPLPPELRRLAEALDRLLDSQGRKGAPLDLERGEHPA